ncbi:MULTISPECIES: hybrid sensor histidine kinase/response regulator [unclassified Leptolyngbya]|uniref:hybrid sensor histidine kinase/response regulator n=1 Tax=unclassified Leptolyngbya TaxID=2650499 RepID=UPI001682D03A|nr:MULTISPECIES: hybrid sensor histidine kinase/response regulator [unclassified Leptolyngbya]MBD1913073.1 hybrid sensor histidine kinase/response regulator [Leptolyngbya sp. FACHB-8]MBD2154426.1 hybrid sensor histidine kinase/response regulator [Leptolyngbya sp. FACHB-16]
MSEPPSILIVDDEPNNFDVIEAFLLQEGYQLHYCSLGSNAIEKLSVFCPDVILLDVMMPQMDGIEVCRHIKADPAWQSTPIIMVTALTAKEDLARCLEAGADDFISKPVNALELRARVHSMLRIKQQHDHLERLLQLRQDMVCLLESTLDGVRGSITRSLPHEFNTPINGILGAIDLLLNAPENLDQSEREELLGLIQKSAKRMNRLIQNFLIYGRLELITSDPEAIEKARGQTHITPAKVWITTSAQRLSEQAKRQTDITCTIEDSILSISEKDLQKITEELLDNALKFSQPGSPIQVVGKPVGELFHLSILNYGRGMSDEQIAQIGALVQFDRKSYEQQGSGLGLAIVSKMMQLYGGTFSIQSETNGRTTVELEIPVLAD